MYLHAQQRAPKTIINQNYRPLRNVSKRCSVEQEEEKVREMRSMEALGRNQSVCGLGNGSRPRSCFLGQDWGNEKLAESRRATTTTNQQLHPRTRGMAQRLGTPATAFAGRPFRRGCAVVDGGLGEQTSREGVCVEYPPPNPNGISVVLFTVRTHVPCIQQRLRWARFDCAVESSEYTLRRFGTGARAAQATLKGRLVLFN